MKPNLKIDQEDLKVLFSHTRRAYGNMSFENWKEECKKSYISYFENKSLFNYKRYTYSQFVNAQILVL
tara:strand:+ start:152 stop:355 length:204 start_codon:yes stop_codon:yes gene_type:complete